MTTPRAFRPIIRLVPSALLALLMAGLVDGHVSAPSITSFAAEAPALTAGASLKREIRGGETQTFELQIEASTFLLLEISLRSPNLSFRLSNPGGDVLSEAGGLGPHLLAAITDREGTYRLESIAPKEQRVFTRFTIEVVDLRPMAAGDAARVRAAKALLEARRLLSSDADQRAGAEALLKESLAVWQAAGDVRGEVEALLATAQLWTNRGDMAAALSWLEKAIKRSQENGFSKGEARSLQDIGFCQSQLAHHDEAIRAYSKAVEIWSRVGGPFERSAALNGLGIAYWRKQDPQEAQKAFEDALPLAVESGDLAQQANALASVGSAYYMQARVSKARELLEKGLELSREAGDVKAETEIEHNLAALYYNEGQLQQALNLFIRVAAKQAVKDSGMTRYNMGNLYMLLGDQEKALESYALSQAAFRAAGDVNSEVNALIGIGRVHLQKGDAKAALAEYVKAQQFVPTESWITRHFIGLAQIEADEARAALDSLKRALEMARSAQDRPKEAATLLALGSALAKLGESEQASESLGKAIDVGKEIGYQSLVALALLRRSLLHRQDNRLQDALVDIESAVAIVESTRRSIASDQFRTGFFAARRTYYDLYVDLLMRLDRAHPNGDYRARALETSERGRARGLLDLLAEGRIDIRQGLDPDLLHREDDLSDQTSRVQRELRAARSNPERLKELQAEREALEQQREQLEVEIQTKNPRYAEVRYPNPLKLEEIQNGLLDNKTALLEYVLGEKTSYLFVVTREEIRAYELPASREIGIQALRLREALEQESLLTRRNYLDAAYKLYQELLEPASAALAGKSSLLIVPDGALYYIPFEALLTAPDDRSYRELPYLVRLYSIAYIPSASVLAGLREPRQEPTPPSRKEVVAFAPFASFGSEVAARRDAQQAALKSAASRWVFQPLPASGQEISNIAGLYPGRSLSFVGNAADEAAVTSNPAVASARRLHFATHAQIDERRPEYSALVLAEKSGEDGLLQMREILNLRLSADLVVLSACQTALGREVSGEGLMGLTRAFFYAGVPSLVVSLWNVVDGPTPALMVDFYKHLDGPQSKAKALQASKLSMIDQGSFAHPSYWAPFILLGEPQ